jgi:DNA-binding HxlR family transcriptional regulator
MTKKRELLNPRYMATVLLGCKWTLSVVGALQRGVRRPGRMRVAISGISTKILNDRLAKLMRFGLISKKIYPVTPPRVEYAFTSRGRRFLKILKIIDRFTK